MIQRICLRWCVPVVKLALIGLLGLPVAGCSPSFLSLFGVDPISRAQPPSGFVVINFENETDTRARLRIQVQSATSISTADLGPTIDDPRFSGVEPMDSEIRVFECDVSQVLVVTVEVLVPEEVTVLDFVAITNAAGVGTRRLEPVNIIPSGFIQLQLTGVPGINSPRCGSVITFTLTGSLDVPIRTYFDPVSQQTVEDAPAFIQNVDPPFPQITDFLIRVRVE